MKMQMRRVCVFAGMITAWLGSHIAAIGQESREPTSAAATTAPQEDPHQSARRAILEGERWQQTMRRLNDWVSVQRIYSPEEIAHIRASMTQRIERMSPQELEQFMDDLNQRLDVLLSPDAADARSWLNQYLAAVRDPEERLREMRPDLVNMTASQIRQELRDFQERRASRRRAQEAFDRTRQQQVQSLMSSPPAAQAGQQAPLPQPAATFGNDSQFRSPYAPIPRAPRRPLPPPGYGLGPWGGPLLWYPVHPVWW